MAKESFIQPRFVGARFDESTLRSNTEKPLAHSWKEWSKSLPPGIACPIEVSDDDGNVILEWIKPAARIELEVNGRENRLELYATNIETGVFVEESFKAADLADAFQRVSELL